MPSFTLGYIRLSCVRGLLTQVTKRPLQLDFVVYHTCREIWQRWLGLLQVHDFPSSKRCFSGEAHIWEGMCFPVLFYFRCSHVAVFYKVAWTQMDIPSILKCGNILSPCPSQKWRIMKTQKKMVSLTNKRWAGSLQGEDRQGLVFILK